jgi:integrase/recombinase XerD
MAKSKIKLNNSNGLDPLSLSARQDKNTITVEQFFILHQQFIQDKALEGLAPRTIKDHITHMQYLKSYIEEVKRSDIDRSSIDLEFLKGYLYFMIHDKELKPCTINVRIRTLKCYIRWLYENKHIIENHALKLKLVKVPQDTIKPLCDNDIKKMLLAPDRSTYAGLRDFTIMLVILDCGIRIGELCNVTIDDVDLKNRLLYVKAENAKTRKYRELPLSKQTCILFKQLIEIAKEYDCKYIFNSSVTAEKIDQNVIIKNFEKYGKKVNLKVRCTPCVFRHTFATNAVKAGIDSFTLQKIMGHSSLITTRQYVQLMGEDIKKKHDKYSSVHKFID